MVYLLYYIIILENNTYVYVWVRVCMSVCIYIMLVYAGMYVYIFLWIYFRLSVNVQALYHLSYIDLLLFCYLNSGFIPITRSLYGVLWAEGGRSTCM